MYHKLKNDSIGLNVAAAAVFAAVGTANAQVIYNNGGTNTTAGIITGLGVGPVTGNNVSQATAAVNNGGLTVSGNFRVADDFTIAARTNVTRLGVFAYMTGTYSDPSVSPFTGITVNIWNASPGSDGASIVASSAVMASTSWTGITRHFDGAAALADARRPVMEIVAQFGGEELSPGTYWIDYGLTGQLSANTNAFTPFVMNGLDAGRSTALGNAMQFNAGVWATTGVGSSLQAVDVPFYVVPSPSAAALLGIGGLVAMRRRRA